MMENAQHTDDRTRPNTATPEAGIPDPAAASPTATEPHATTDEPYATGAEPHPTTDEPYATTGPYATTTGPYATFGDSGAATGEPYPATGTYAPPASKPVRLFRRSRSDRMLGGVCAGLAKALNVDVTLLRVAFVAATVLGFGAAAVIYLVCWLVVPEEDAIG